MISSSSSGYEKCREERIKQNLERMKKLGILDLSLKLKHHHHTPPPPNSKNKKNKKPSPFLNPNSSSFHLPSSAPLRRSSRLGNATTVSYTEVKLPKKGALGTEEVELIGEGSKPEIYTEEHEKLLGDTNLSWKLFVDGYAKDGKRIYDPVRGKTCHQCRQKTLGHRTQCSQCNKVQGQFCGDCLYMRYGENVLEAKQNPDWICPVCRGICNCSLCRKAKGWPRTGTMYKKISSMGFKSVAHYLIQTQRSAADLEKDSGTKIPVSAKRSLPFSRMEATPLSKESADPSKALKLAAKLEFEVDYKTNDSYKEEGEAADLMQSSGKGHGVANLAPQSSADVQESSVLHSTYNKTVDELEGKEEEAMQLVNDEDGKSSVKAKKIPETDEEKPIDDSNIAPKSNPSPTTISELTTGDHQGLAKPKTEDYKTGDLFTREGLCVQFSDNKLCDSSSIAPKTVLRQCSKRKTSACAEPDSIGARLRQRRGGVHRQSTEAHMTG